MSFFEKLCMLVLAICVVLSGITYIHSIMLQDEIDRVDAIVDAEFDAYEPPMLYCGTSTC